MQTRQFHIDCTAEDIGDYVFLPGDPGRTAQIASYLENPRLVAQKREFTTYTGTLDGIKVSVTSTGIGGPSAAIALEELSAIGAHTFLRIGTCGGMQPSLKPGRLIIPTAAIRMEGTSQEYLPLAFPAAADFSLVQLLVQAAQEKNFDYNVGVVHCKDSFYGQHSPQTMPIADTLQKNWQAWQAGGALASEMESAALFIVATVRHVRCATVLQMLWNQTREQVIRDEAHAQSDMTCAIETAVCAMRQCIRHDCADAALND